MQEYTFDLKEYRKKINNKRSSGAPFFIYVFVCIILMGAIFFLKPKTKKESYVLYFAEINSFLNYGDANNLASEIQSKNGAGYVYFDGKYHVFANLYLSKQDASAVCENLKNDYPSSKVFELEYNNNINVNQLNDAQKIAIKDFATMGKNLLDNIYYNILAFDKAEIEKAQLTLNFKTLANKFDDCLNNFNSAFSENSKFNKAKTHLGELKTALNNLANENCNLKYELIKFAINYSNVLSCF